MATAQNFEDEMVILFTNYSSTLQNSFATFFCNDALSDATIICENQPIHVHRFLLSVSSPFFDNMFRRFGGEIIIRNINYVNLMKVLSYIYTGNVQLYEHEVYGFLVAAKRLTVKITLNYSEYTDRMVQCLKFMEHEIETREYSVEQFYHIYPE